MPVAAVTIVERVISMRVPRLTLKDRADSTKHSLTNLGELTPAILNAEAAKTDSHPTAAQKESGNYKKGRVRWKGLDIAIETAAGQRRKPEWAPLANHYGYIKRTKSEADGDAIDVFVSDAHLDSEIVFVINQLKKDGSWDEVKCIVGEISEPAARKTYLANYEPGWKGLGSVVAMTLSQFKRWLTDGETGRAVKEADLPVKAGAARDEVFTGVPNLVADERTVSQPSQSRVQVVRSEGYQGLQKVAEEFYGVLSRHGAAAGRINTGKKEEQRSLLSGKLCLGDDARSTAKQAEQRVDHVQRREDDSSRLGKEVGDENERFTGSSGRVRLDRQTSFNDTVKRAAQEQPYANICRQNTADGALGERTEVKLQTTKGLVAGGMVGRESPDNPVTIQKLDLKLTKQAHLQTRDGDDAAATQSASLIPDGYRGEVLGLSGAGLRSGVRHAVSVRPGDESGAVVAVQQKAAATRQHQSGPHAVSTGDTTVNVDSLYYDREEPDENLLAAAVTEQLLKTQTPLAALQQAKTHSDKRNYAAKHNILLRQLTQSPVDFAVSDQTGKYPGLTHLPTGFQLHAPRHIAARATGKLASDNKDRPFTIAIDLDGTLAKAEEPFNPETIGKPRRKAKKYMKAFHKAGARLIIFTVRGNTALVKQWLQEHKIPYDYVNENPNQPPDSSGKVFADAYWDDRAYNALELDEHGPALLAKAEAHIKTAAADLWTSPAELLEALLSWQRIEK